MNSLRIYLRTTYKIVLGILIATTLKFYVLPKTINFLIKHKTLDLSVKYQISDYISIPADSFFSLVILLLLLIILISPYQKIFIKDLFYVNPNYNYRPVLYISILAYIILFFKDIYIVILLLPFVIFISNKIVSKLSNLRINTKIGFANTKEADNLLDNSINTIAEDKLGREKFIEQFSKSIKQESDNNYFGKKIILNGHWGEGKTSCLKMCIQYFKNQNLDNYKFIWVNPWFNDSKEKFINSIFNQLDNILSNNYPFKKITNLKKQYFRLSEINIGNCLSDYINGINISFDNNNKKDIDVTQTIEYLEEILKLLDKKIIIFIDDIDRLSREQILFILEVVQMFSEKTSLTFVLPIDTNKTEEILLDLSTSYIRNKYAFNKLSYKNYLDKITSLIIPLPKIEHKFIEIFLIGYLEKFYTEEIETYGGIEEFKFKIKMHSTTSAFKTLRNVKRFLNLFNNSYMPVKGEVDFINYFNITMLRFFFPNLYEEAYFNKERWFSHEDNANKDVTIKYFKNLIIDPIYKGQEKTLEELFYAISQKYASLFFDIDTLDSIITPYIGEKTYLKKYRTFGAVDDRYWNLYFSDYFDNENRLPSKLLDSKFISWIEMLNKNHSANLTKDIQIFIITLTNNQIIDIFEHILSKITNSENQKEKLEQYFELFKNIFISFALISNVLDKQHKKFEYYPIINIYTQISYFVTSYANVTLDNKIMFENIKSGVFAMLLYMEFVNIHSVNSEIEEIMNNKIKNNMHLFLNSLIYRNQLYLLYWWITDYYSKDKKLEPKALNQQKKEYVLKYLQKPKYFWLFIGEFLKTGDKKQTIDIWGKETIEKLRTDIINSANKASKTIDFFHYIKDLKF